MRRNLKDRSDAAVAQGKKARPEKMRCEYLIPRHLVLKLRAYADANSKTTGQVLSELIAGLPKVETD